MPYDDVFAARLRAVLGSLAGLEEKKMFGGIGFLVNGNMACGIHQDDLIVRVGPVDYEQSLLQPHTRPFDMTGRPMTGWVMVEPQGCDTQAKLQEWVDRGVAFALSLPPKQK